MAIIQEKQGVPTEQTSELSSECAESVALEADYAEDRPISLLAERQREFQRAMQAHYLDTGMPAA